MRRRQPRRCPISTRQTSSRCSLLRWLTSERSLHADVSFLPRSPPISIDANGEVINQRTVQVVVPYKYLYLFDEPRSAHVSFEGNDNASCNCDITSYKARLIHREDGNYFMAIATVSTQGQNSPVLQKYIKADVRIIVSNRTLWKQVFE